MRPAPHADKAWRQASLLDDPNTSRPAGTEACRYARVAELSAMFLARGFLLDHASELDSFRHAIAEIAQDFLRGVTGEKLQVANRSRVRRSARGQHDRVVQ